MPSTRSRKTCAGCIWYDQCGLDQCADIMICDDYSPADDGAEDTYEEDLVMRRSTYQEMIDEYSDNTPLSDQMVM